MYCISLSWQKVCNYMYTRAGYAGVGELSIECLQVAVAQHSVEQILILELMVKGHVMDEVSSVEILAQLNGSLATCTVNYIVKGTNNNNNNNIIMISPGTLLTTIVTVISRLHYIILAHTEILTAVSFNTQLSQNSYFCIPFLQWASRRADGQRRCSCSWPIGRCDCRWGHCCHESHGRGRLVRQGCSQDNCHHHHHLYYSKIYDRVCVYWGGGGRMEGEMSMVWKKHRISLCSIFRRWHHYKCQQWK